MSTVYYDETELNSSNSALQKVQVANSRVQWGAIIAGTFVTLLVYYGLVWLGIAFGGSSLQDTAQSSNWGALKDLGIGASLWTVISALISICVGSYVSARIAGLVSTRVGRAQGLVITSLFFILMFTQASMMLGGLVGTLGSAVSSVSGGTFNAATSERGSQIIEDSIGNLDLKSPLPQVVHGLAARLAAGDDDAAVTYLANQSGLNQADARARYLGFKDRFLEVGRQAATATARAMKYVGTTLFLSIVLGAFAAMLGGAWGAGYNLQMPVSRMDFKAMQMRPATVRST